MNAPDLQTFHWLLQIISETRNLPVERKVELAQSVLTHLLDRSSSAQRRGGRGGGGGGGRWGSSSSSLLPNVRTLNLVLSVYGLRQDRRRAITRIGGNRSGSSSTTTTGGRPADQFSREALELFRKWQAWYGQGVVKSDVNLISYNKLMTVLSRSARVSEVEALFAELRSRAESDATFRPDVVTFGGLLTAYAMVGKTETVTSMLDDMLSTNNNNNKGYPPPNSVTLNDVLYAYANAKKLRNVMTFFKWWETRSGLSSDDDDKDGGSDDDRNVMVKPNIRSYNIVLHAIASTASFRAYHKARYFFESIPLQKDSVTYTTMISVITKNMAGVPAIEAVTEILNQAKADPGIEIDDPFVTKVLYALATINEPEMPLLADQLVADHCPTPNMVVLEALVHCWSKSTDKNAAGRALEILKGAEADDAQKPSVKLYTNTIDAMKNEPTQDTLDVVERILTQMETIGPAPNVATYSAVISSIARSRIPNRVPVAFDILQRMKVPPNVIVYNNVLNVCEHSPQESAVAAENLRIATTVFMQARNDKKVELSHVTYGCFISTIGNLMEPSDERDNLILQVFNECRREGQVSSYVVHKMSGALISKALLRVAFEGYSDDDLPPSWTKNVKNVPARFQL